MSFVRPEVSALFARWGEVIGSAAASLFGLWVLTRGGLFYGTLGGIVLLFGLAFGMVAIRRMRFELGIGAPGVVDIDEGKIAYMGPVFGGFVGLSDLMELQVLEIAGKRRCWRLKTSEGEALLIPFAAEGAAALFDTFAGLPSLEPRALVRAADQPAETPITVWRRPHAGA